MKLTKFANRDNLLILFNRSELVVYCKIIRRFNGKITGNRGPRL